MSVQTEDAQITSTAVEIDTLRVSGRQLTLRTFRQIQRASVINPKTHEFRDEVDEIWGWVNYFWDGCSGDIHAVYQRGNELYRCPLSYVEKSADGYLKQGQHQIFGPTPKYMPTPKLEEIAKELNEDITMHEPSPGCGYDMDESMKRIKDDVWFERFAEAIREWNARVRAVEDEGQLFIAT